VSWAAQIRNMPPLDPDPSDPFLVRLNDLRSLLAGVVYEDKRWWIDDPPIFGHAARQLMITVNHSNPVPGQMTDELSFLVPVMVRSEPPPNHLLVCFDPWLIQAEIEGLYWEVDTVKGDSIEDWFSFWGPLEVALSDYVRKGSW
jgi:hypothetical protein